MKKLAGVDGVAAFADAAKGCAVGAGSERSNTRTGRWRSRDSVKNLAWIIMLEGYQSVNGTRGSLLHPMVQHSRPAWWLPSRCARQQAQH